MSKILYVCSEAYPLVKTGGLADVAGSLPPELLKLSQDVRLLLPAYPYVLKEISDGKLIAASHYYGQSVKIIETKLPGTKVIVWLVDCPSAFNRPGGPYNDHHGHFWHDNDFRFTMFCHTAVDIALNQLELNWQPEIVHCNDWQTGLIPALLGLHKNRPATIFTIHNIAYQGIFEKQSFFDLHLPEELWHVDGVEFYDSFSFLKGGLFFADKVTTVSPQYAKEILSPEFGYGLSGLLQHREADLSGILNGIDKKYWNPGTDKYLVQNYSRHSLAKKSINKIHLQKEFSLKPDKSTLLIGMVSRLVEQKGLEFILQSLPKILKLPIQLVILGTGDIHYEIQLSELAQQHPQQLHVIIGYDEALAHRIEASCDVFLMPSTFEPCGLNQMYSLRYGTLPLVTPVGGLADTVIDANNKNIANNTANGFVITKADTKSLTKGIKRVLQTYQQKKLWKKLQTNAMQGDFSWETSAKHYIDLYQELISS